MKKIFFIMITFSFLMYSCEKEEANLQNKSLYESYDTHEMGIEMFRAIYLLQGPMAERITLYQGLVYEINEREANDVDFANQRNSFANHLIQLVNEYDPDYFSNFFHSIESRDINIIESTFAETAAILNEVLIDDSNFSLDVPDLQTLIKEQMQLQCLWAAAVVAAVVWEAAVAVNVAAIATVVVYKYAKFWGSSYANDDEYGTYEIEHEQFLVDVSSLLDYYVD